MTEPVETAKPIEIVLFDLGGVLTFTRGVAELRELAAIDSDAEIWTRWLACPWVRRFESGRCSAEAFADGLVAEWGLPVSGDEFLATFRTWPSGALEGAEALVAETAQQTVVGCLSNTNRLQWEEHQSRWPLTARFDRNLRFLSFELGELKPDRVVFDVVAARLPVPPWRVLFLDDNAPNVDGARAAGFMAEQVSGVDEARQALEAAGVLSPATTGV